MPTICPKCQAPRPADAKTPDWQCPVCGIAYSRAAYDLARAKTQYRDPVAPVARSRPVVTESGESFPWGKLLGLLLLLGLLYAAQQTVRKRGGFEALFNAATAATTTGSVAGAGGSAGSPNLSAQQLGALAAGAQEQDVILYSADWCPHCRAAKGWLAQYGFKYRECNVEKEALCAQQLDSFGGGSAIPHLIVKGRHMSGGFDPDEFVALLSK